MRKNKRFNTAAVILAAMLAFSGVGTAFADPVGDTVIEEIVSIEGDSAEIQEESAEEETAEAVEAAEEETAEAVEEETPEDVEAAEEETTEAAEEETAEAAEEETAEAAEEETAEAAEEETAEAAEEETAEAAEEETAETAEEETAEAVEKETAPVSGEEIPPKEQVELIDNGMASIVEQKLEIQSMSLTITDNSPNGVNLKWDDLYDRDYYLLYRNGVEIKNTTYHVVTDYLIEEGVNTYYVEAYKNGSVYARSPVKSINYVLPKTITLNADKSFKQKYLDISWNHYISDAKYDILYRNDEQIFTQPSSPDHIITYKDYDLENGELYAYYVVAVNASGEEISRSNTSMIMFNVVNITAVGNTTKGVVVYWDGTPAASSYSLTRRKEKTDGPDNPGEWDGDDDPSYMYVEGVKGTSYTFPLDNLTSGNLYEYWIEAYTGVGEKLCEDCFVKRYIGTTTMKAPTCTAKGLRVSWPKVPGAKKYVIMRSAGAGAPNWKYLTTVTATNAAEQVFNNNGTFTPGKWYAYTVRAIGEENPYNDDTSYGGQPAGRSVRYREPVRVTKLQSISAGVRATFTSVKAGYTYGLYRAPVTNGTVGSYTRVAPVTSTTVGKDVWITDKTAVNGRGYSYYVRCLSKDLAVPLSSYANEMKITYRKP